MRDVSDRNRMVPGLSIAILTTCRYFPWSGQNVCAFDRIWGDADTILDCEMLVLGRGDHFDEINKHPKKLLIDDGKITLKAIQYFIYCFFRSNLLALFNFDRRYLLGRMLFPSIRWYWSYAKVREYLESSAISVLLFHGEFNQWGLAVAWACHDARITPVACQHGMFPREWSQYRHVKSNKLVPYARYLFVWSEYFKKISSEMLAPEVSVYDVGTRRLIRSSKNNLPSLGEKIVICPSTPDHENYMCWLNENRSQILQTGKFLLRPHPLRNVPKHISDWLPIDSDDIAETFSRARAVLLSSSSIAVEALQLGIPVILLRNLIPDDLSAYDFETSLPGFFVVETQDDILQCLDHLEHLDASDRVRFRRSANYYADDLSVNKVWDALHSIHKAEEGL